MKAGVIIERHWKKWLKGSSALSKEFRLHNTENGKFSSQIAHSMAREAACSLLNSFVHSKNTIDEAS